MSLVIRHICLTSIEVCINLHLISKPNLIAIDLVENLISALRNLDGLGLNYASDIKLSSWDLLDAWSVGPGD